jgi:hypothetical protein
MTSTTVLSPQFLFSASTTHYAIALGGLSQWLFLCATIAAVKCDTSTTTATAPIGYQARRGCEKE